MKEIYRDYGLKRSKEYRKDIKKAITSEKEHCIKRYTIKSINTS